MKIVTRERAGDDCNFAHTQTTARRQLLSSSAFCNFALNRQRHTINRFSVSLRQSHIDNEFEICIHNEQCRLWHRNRSMANKKEYQLIKRLFVTTMKWHERRELNTESILLCCAQSVVCVEARDLPRLFWPNKSVERECACQTTFERREKKNHKNFFFSV